MFQVRGELFPRSLHRPALITCFLLALAGCDKRDAHLDVSTTSIDLGTDRSSATFTVHNSSRDLLFTSGVAPLDYQIHTDVDWMTVTPTSGSLGENEKRTHTVEIHRSSLGDGDHTGLVLITSNGGDATIVIHFVNGGVVSCTAKPSAPSGPAPGAGAGGVATGADLSWSGGSSQCPGLTATYDVHFGTSASPPFVHDNGTSKTWDPGPLDTGTTYFWQIVAKDANGSTAGPVWSFTTASGTPPPTSCTTPPSAPSLAAPADGASGTSIDQNLSWTGGTSQCSGLTATYDVYFGTSSSPPFVHDNGTAKTWDPGTLANGTTYWWKVVAKDANGSMASPVASFTTVDAAPPPPACTSPPAAACTPNPSDRKTNVNENTNLGWSCGDSACGLTVSYDVYFGTNPTPGAAELVGNTVTKAWNLAPLLKNTTYYWKVVTKDANGTTAGPVWSFKTRS